MCHILIAVHPIGFTDLVNPIEYLYYFTDIILPPFVFGLGILGNFLLLVVLSGRNLRWSNPVYVYITSVTVLDLLVLLGSVPVYIRDASLLPVDITYGFDMAYAVWFHSTLLHPSFRQASGWLAASMGIVRCFEVISSRCCSSAKTSSVNRMTSSAVTRHCWTRISASRIIVFVCIVFCLLLNVTGLFDTAVVQLSICPKDDSMNVTYWTHNFTNIALNSRISRDVMPMLRSIIGDVIPIVTCLVFSFLLACCVAYGRSARNVVMIRMPRTRDEEECQLSACVFFVMIAVVVLEAPTAVVTLVRAFFIPDVPELRVLVAKPVTWLSYVTLLAGLLSRIRCIVNFFLLALTNHNYRKTFRRTFCCCVSATVDVDEFYEPWTCCGYNEQGETSDFSMCCSGKRDTDSITSYEIKSIDDVAHSLDILESQDTLNAIERVYGNGLKYQYVGSARKNSNIYETVTNGAGRLPRITGMSGMSRKVSLISNNNDDAVNASWI